MCLIPASSSLLGSLELHLGAVLGATLLAAPESWSWAVKGEGEQSRKYYPEPASRHLWMKSTGSKQRQTGTFSDLPHHHSPRPAGRRAAAAWGWQDAPGLGWERSDALPDPQVLLWGVSTQSLIAPLLTQDSSSRRRRIALTAPGAECLHQTPGTRLCDERLGRWMVLNVSESSPGCRDDF